MNRNEFMSVARLTSKPVTVIQHDDKGYSLNLIDTDEEGKEVIETLIYNNEPRYFKSLAGVETTLKDQQIYNFNVRMSSELIAKKTRVTRSEDEKKAIELAKVESAYKKAQLKAKEAQEKMNKLKHSK